MNVRQVEFRDINAILKIEKRVWGDFGANEGQIICRLNTFAKGSILVESDEQIIVGYAAAQLVNSLSNSSWNEQTDLGTIQSTHVPEGRIAYGVNMSGLPEAAGCNIGSLIINHYRRQFIESGDCDALALGSRAPGFASWRNKTSKSFSDYLQLSRNGFSIDPELRLYQKNGFKILWQLPGYFEDAVSDNYGVMIVGL